MDAPEFPIYTGVWTNWSYGPHKGLMLTLPNFQATIFISCIAFFVATVAAYLWRIACFALHHYFSTHIPRDAIHHQRQAILRNASEPSHGIIVLSQLLWAWGKVSLRRALHASLPLIAFAVVLVVGFAVASALTANLAISNVVLISTNNSATLLSSMANSYLVESVLEPLRNRQFKAAQNYAQQCYTHLNRSTGVGSLGCGTFVQKQIAFSVNDNAPCPFQDLCVRDNANLVLDTGLLDSNDDFGLNAPKSGRWQYRRVLSCAPLKTEGFTFQVNKSATESFTAFAYGNSGGRNYTNMFSNDALSVERFANATNPTATYGLITRTATFYPNGSVTSGNNFEPIPQLVRPDGLLVLIFMSAGGIKFGNKSTDDWYRATKVSGSFLRHGNVSLDAYVQDNAASPMACLEQDQYCNPNQKDESKRCSPLSSIQFATDDAVRAMFDDEESHKRFSWGAVAGPSNSALFNGILNYLGPQSMASSDTFKLGVQGPISDRQWQLDVRNWFSIHLARIQDSFVTCASGQYPKEMYDTPGFLRAPPSPGERFASQTQKVTSRGHTSLSLFGILLVFGLGLAIIILSLSLEYIVAWIQEKRRTDPYSRREWVANHMLQVQRAAFEANGVGSWYKRTSSIPITDSDTKLAAFMQAGNAYGLVEKRETKVTEDRTSEELKKGWQRVDSGSSLSPGLVSPKHHLGRVDTDRTLA